MGIKNFILRYSLWCYFFSTFLLSWLSAAIVIAPCVLAGKPVDKIHGILMFPAMIIWPCLLGILLTRITGGKSGLRQLFSRMKIWKFERPWYPWTILIPPVLIMIVLFFLEHLRSGNYARNYFFTGIAFGIPAGFFEEFGWTGFAFMKMHKRQGVIGSGVTLGILWSLWHLPAIDFLGAASPHGQWLLAFFLSFTLIMTAMRLLIVWLYSRTGSLLLAQVMHAISTSSLILFGPASLSPSQEATWYALYGGILWMVVLLLLWSEDQENERRTLRFLPDDRNWS
jgi:uncharacterized protein